MSEAIGKDGEVVYTVDTLTDQMVEESVHRNMGKMRENKADFLSLKVLLKQVEERYGEDYVPDKDDLGEFWEERDKVVDIVKKYSCCKEGCSWCCNMAVGVTSVDADIIYRATGIEPKKVVIDLERLMEEGESRVRKYMNVPCPFLKDSKCSVYEHRPSACRTHFNMSDYPQVCDLGGFVERDVPNVDLRDLWVAEARICFGLGVCMGDIREYFPHVKEGKVVEE